MATLKYLSQYFSTTLNVGGGIDDTQTTGIVLQSVSGVTITKPGQICVSYSDPLDTGVAEWIDYTSINGSNELVGVTRGREGYAAKSHLQGATVTFVMSASHHNDVVDLLNGTEAGIKVKTAIYDANGNEVIKTPATTDAVNEVTVTNSATGNAVQVSATGGDTNIDLELVAKGTGGISDKNGDYLSPNSSLSRQAIINGNFDVWQRGTSLAVNGIVIIADRWKMYTNSSGMANTFSQADASDLSGSQYAAKWQRTAGQTGTTNFLLGTSLETKDSIKFRGKKVTLSFYAKAGANYSAASGYLVSTIYTGTGTDGEVIAGFTGSAVAKTQNNVLTTSWQKFTLTTTNVIAASVNQIGIRFDDTPVGTAGADDSFYITQVQLCAGDVALPFQPKSFEEELRACMRYYQKSFAYATAPATAIASYVGAIAVKVNVAAAGKYSSTWVNFPVRMRVVPTIVFYNPISANTKFYNRAGADSAEGATSFNELNENGINLENAQVAADAIGNNCYINYAVSAEL